MKISKKDLEQQTAKQIGMQLIKGTRDTSPRGVGLTFVPIVRMPNGIMAVLGSHSVDTTLN
jgi:hypothetical protein